MKGSGSRAPEASIYSAFVDGLCQSVDQIEDEFQTTDADDDGSWNLAVVRRRTSTDSKEIRRKPYGRGQGRDDGTDGEKSRRSPSKKRIARRDGDRQQKRAQTQPQRNTRRLKEKLPAIHENPQLLTFKEIRNNLYKMRLRQATMARVLVELKEHVTKKRREAKVRKLDAELAAIEKAASA